MKVCHLLGGPQVCLQVHITTSNQGRGHVTWTDILQEMVGHMNTCCERTTLNVCKYLICALDTDMHV